jgi:serine/threonine protein kinase
VVAKTDVVVDAERIVFRGESLDLPTYRVDRLIGSGANGFVVLCQNRTLDRVEALKVWAQLRPNDTRDKFEQGMKEAQKAAAAASGVVPIVYSAGTVNGKYFYATMQFIVGETVAEYIEKESGLFARSVVADAYVYAIRRTTESGYIHGDPHTKNVMIRNIYDKQVHLALLDFGTSHFTSSSRLETRHWKVVDETLDRLYGGHRLYRSIEKLRPTSPSYVQLAHYEEVARTMRASLAELD